MQYLLRKVRNFFVKSMLILVFHFFQELTIVYIVQSTTKDGHL